MKFDTDKRHICDVCFDWIEPEDPKIVVGRAEDWIEVYHPDCIAHPPREENDKSWHQKVKQMLDDGV